MKSLVKAVAVAAVLAVPAISFAQQSNQPLTRAEVRNQLVQLENAGYRPEINDPYYPAKLQEAEARVAQQNSGYGPATSGSSQSGSHSGAVSSYSPPVYTR
jgi:hypothetical protein